MTMASAADGTNSRMPTNNKLPRVKIVHGVTCFDPHSHETARKLEWFQTLIWSSCVAAFRLHCGIWRFSSS
jgi:hypothetical protein